jgi:inhibitor of KinA sporulation pathway (predicted exonuclease)
MSRHFLAIDCEFEQPSCALIQIGACIGDLHTGEIVESFSRFIKTGVPLSQFISKLTGITDYQIETEGVSLVAAYNDLLAFRARYPDIFPASVTWGAGDMWQIKKQVTDEQHKVLSDLQIVWPFGNSEMDTKKFYQAYRIANGLSYRSGLGKSMGRLGLQFRGRAHNAQIDAENTWRTFHHLIGKMKQ